MEPLTSEELRVVACLVEKQLTTPDNYPLTENAVVAACNQLSNRNPVVAYDTNTVRVTLTALRQRGLARVIHTPGARVPKHRHIVDEALGLSPGEVSLLAVLALRGPQTVGELRTRTERMHDFAGLSEVEEALEGLAGREEPLVVRLERQPGQKEARYAQLLGGPVDAARTPAGRKRTGPPAPQPPPRKGAPPPRPPRPPRSAPTAWPPSKPASRPSKPTWPSSRPSTGNCAMSSASAPARRAGRPRASTKSSEPGTEVLVGLGAGGIGPQR
jgi:uncharacterized protein YceH (UPF0502 family)